MSTALSSVMVNGEERRQVPSNRRYYESASRAIARDRNLFRICGLEAELWPDDPRQWSRTTLDLMGVRVEDVWGQPLEEATA